MPVVVGPVTPTPPIGASVIASDLVEEVRQLVIGGSAEAFDIVDVNGIPATPATGLITFGVQLSDKRMATGTRFSIGLEDFLCTSLAAPNVTALRAMNGTKAYGHNANDLVRINPKLSDFMIFRALNQDIQDMASPNGLFRDPLPFIDLTYAPQTVGYDLAGISSSFTSIYEVRHGVYGPSQNWPKVNNWRLGRTLDTTIFPSGFTLFVDDGMQAGVKMRVLYKATFSTLAGLSDNVVGVTGMGASQLDIPVLGAAHRLTTTREVKRAQIEAQPARNLQDTPPQAMTAGARNFLALRTARLNSEIISLKAKYPIQLRG